MVVARSSDSIEAWLESLKKGYGERFSAVFEELGVEDVSDLAELIDKTGDSALKKALEARGAKTIQIQKIRRAISEVGAPAAQSIGGAAELPTAGASWSYGDQGGQAPSYPRPQPTKTTPSDIPGLVNLQCGDGPRIYFVHGMDGDISGAGYSYRGIAPCLAPCHSCALVFDSEAASCDSIQSLALLYSQRVMADAVRHPRSPMIIAGYSLGCMIAHQMALLFQDNFTEVSLVLFGFEVTWPPERSWLRVGGYEWLGGDIEATLLVTRSLPGGQEWASKEAQALLRLPEQERDAGDVQWRAFSDVVGKRRSSRWADFQSYVARGGHNMDALHRMAQGLLAPPAVFKGKALLVLAPESPESNFPARYVNMKYCDSLEVVYASGTHFNMLQKDKAPHAAGSVLSFLQAIGHLSPEWEAWDAQYFW